MVELMFKLSICHIIYYLSRYKSCCYSHIVELQIIASDMNPSIVIIYLLPKNLFNCNSFTFLFILTASKPASKVCTTVSGASPNLPCIFPFRFNGVTHNKCTWDQAHLTEHKAWCSTLVDETGHHVGGQGKWGNCGPSCPIPPDNRNKGSGILAPGKTSLSNFKY